MSYFKFFLVEFSLFIWISKNKLFIITRRFFFSFEYDDIINRRNRYLGTISKQKKKIGYCDFLRFHLISMQMRNNGIQGVCQEDSNFNSSFELIRKID